jgi:DNA primase
MVDDNIIEEIKSRLDIIDVISDYADLKKAGSNFKGLCPFHSEKTPSFTVSPQKQIFHCFGCGAGGDIFGFIMRYENVPFPEALETLAKKAGVELKQSYARKPRKENETIFKINEDATNFFTAQIEKNKEVRGYFKKRGINEKTIQEFRLGYAPPSYESLLKHLKQKGYSESSLEKAGLIKYSEKGKPYDMFRGRIIFPITDISGKIIAFGGRILDSKKDTKAPKYINSPETPVFKKSYTLYGLNSANKAIREKNYAIIAEGYTDVIVCHQYGFRHAVAPLGTALTEGHLRKIRAYAKKLLLIFDADEAGINAARRSLRLIYENGLRAKVLALPEDNDPDSFLRDKGAEEFQKLFPISKDIVDFFLSLDGDRIELIRELIEITSKVPDAILRGELVNEISQKTSISSIYVTEEIQKFRKKEKNISKRKGELKATLPEELLISIALTKPENFKNIINKINIEDIEKIPLKTILLRVKEMRDIPSLDNLSSVFSESEASYITSLTIDQGLDEERVSDIIDDCLIKIRKRTLNKKIEEIDQYINIADSTGDTSKVDSLMSEKLRLIQEAQE